MYGYLRRIECRGRPLWCSVLGVIVYVGRMSRRQSAVVCQEPSLQHVRLKNGGGQMSNKRDLNNPPEFLASEAFVLQMAGTASCIMNGARY